MDDEDGEPSCDITGRCVGWSVMSTGGICSCRYCGKELHYRDGAEGVGWYTWDAKPPSERRQWEE